jgi:hypothetical protein
VIGDKASSFVGSGRSFDRALPTDLSPAANSLVCCQVLRVIVYRGQARLPQGFFLAALTGGHFWQALPGDVEQFVAVLKGARFAMATYDLDFLLLTEVCEGAVATYPAVVRMCAKPVAPNTPGCRTSRAMVALRESCCSRSTARLSGSGRGQKVFFEAWSFLLQMPRSSGVLP